MSTPKPREKVNRQPRKEATRNDSHSVQQQDWSQFWPTADSATDAATDSLVQKVVTDLEQRSVADYLEGQRSESQGQ